MIQYRKIILKGEIKVMQEILEMVKKALDQLYKKEEEIFLNDCSERNLVFHFARYFIEDNKMLDKELSVDLEYNRNTNNPKKIKEIGESYRIYPDFILHKRNSNAKNILAIEFKKWNNTNYTKDKRKLRYLINQDKEYRYQVGLLIKLGKTREKVRCTLYRNGEEEEIHI